MTYLLSFPELCDYYYFFLKGIVWSLYVQLIARWTFETSNCMSSKHSRKPALLWLSGVFSIMFCMHDENVILVPWIYEKGARQNTMLLICIFNHMLVRLSQKNHMVCTSDLQIISMSSVYHKCITPGPKHPDPHRHHRVLAPDRCIFWTTASISQAQRWFS